MSKLDSIYISGIRSFGIDKQSAQKIKFYSPLTLFLGQNGCGKTTIIESIRHACTGDIPGGSKSGQGFISDPYMHQVSQVHGQVKLCLTDVRGKKANISRIMKCERSGSNQLKFSTLDSTINYIKANGEEETHTGRINDLNSMVIQLLGVPQAILNNVIFCAQDLSLWPLDEGSILKKRFDEIFDSVKYNQCVESLRKEVKLRTDQIKVIKVELLHKKDIKEEVERKKLRLEDREMKLEEANTKIKEKEALLIPIDEKLEEICDLENNLTQLHNKKTAIENELKNLAYIQKDIQSNIKEEISCTDEELQEKIDSFNDAKAVQEEELKRSEERKHELELTETSILDIIRKKNANLVQKNEEKKMLKNKATELNTLITELAKKIKCNIEVDEENVDDAITTLKSSTSKEKASLLKMSEEFKNSNREMQENLDKFHEKLVQTTQEISLKEKDVTELNKQLREFNNKLKDLSVSDDKLKSHDIKIASLDNEIEKLNNSVKEDVINKAMANDKAKIKQYEEKLESLEHDYKILQSNSIAENDLENHKSDILKKENEIYKIKNNCHDNFKLLFTEFPEVNIKRAVEILQIQNSKIVNTINNKINTSERSVTTLQIESQHQEKEIKTLEDELKDCKNKISQLCGNTDYDKKIKQLHLEITKLQRSKGQLSSAKIMYEEFVMDITTKKCCPVCSTNFNKKQAIDEIVTTMKNKIQDIPNELKTVTENLEKNEQLYKNILQLKPFSDKIQELSISIPDLQTKLLKTKSELENNVKTLQQLQRELKKPQAISEACGKVIGSAALLDQHKLDINNLNDKIALLDIHIMKIESKLSKQETETEIDSIKVELTSLRQNCEKSQQKLHLKNKRCQEMRDKKNEIMQDKLNLQKAMQGKPQLLERIQEMKDKEEELNNEIQDLNSSLNPLKSDYEEAKNDLENSKATNDVILESSRNEYHEHVSSLKEIMKLQANIEEISKRNIQADFDKLLEQLTELARKKDEVVASKNTFIESINTLKIQISSQEHYFRTLKDNQTLRLKRKEESVAKKELAELKQNIGNQNYSTVLKEKTKLIKEKNQLDKEIQVSIGKKEELSSSIREIKDDLNQPANKAAALAYNNKFIEFTVKEAVVKDVKLYAEAFENAICTFHKSRMLEINKNIRQLWRQIYRGNDIDYIEIESGEMSYTGNRRNYKYRVMQMKNETLLEMRGRCSAGQKVLACLIIRIALAETFSSNCGILALDEPTTNLDRENIESLSQSLARIINSRQAQRNFQLLIITHDEEFLRTLREVDNINYYYKVHRDNNGNTLVTPEQL